MILLKEVKSLSISNCPVLGRLRVYADEIEELLDYANPDLNSDLSYKIFCDDRNLTIAVDEDHVKLHINFSVSQQARKDIHVGLLCYDSKYQNKGIGLGFTRALFKFAGVNGFNEVSATAGLDIGCYAWARAGAACAQIAVVLLELENRSKALLKVEEMSSECHKEFLKLLHSSDNFHLMYSVSNFICDDKNFGRVFLQGCSNFGALTWDAVWNIDSPGHRQLISKALRMRQ